MKTFRQFNKQLLEGSEYKLYHTSYTSAIDEALAYAKKRGYEYDPEETFDKIGAGPRKPSEGKTVSHTISLTENGRPSRKALHIQVYGMGSKYELNCYIS